MAFFLRQTGRVELCAERLSISASVRSIRPQPIKNASCARSGQMGCEIVRVYKDHGISGTRGRDKRPAFDKLCRDAARREFDVVMAWSVDRLGRSLQDLVGFLSELHALKIDLFLRQQGLDTTTPAGKAMFQIMGVFAEFERAMIAERVRAGLARARGEVTRLARPQSPPLSRPAHSFVAVEHARRCFLHHS